MEGTDIAPDPELDKYNDKRVKVRWWDDPRWYEGLVFKTRKGYHALNSPDLKQAGTSGYLEYSQEFKEVQSV